jgi:methionine synthase I (cobalamin-dependent)
VAAGADIIQTNTFDANQLRLSRVGLQDQVMEAHGTGTGGCPLLTGGQSR